MPTAAITPETLLRTATEMLDARLGDEEAASLAALLDSLGQETQAMRNMDVADVEPAVLYEARP